MVSDDGRGMPDHFADDAFGIEGMRERALLVRWHLGDRVAPRTGHPGDAARSDGRGRLMPVPLTTRILLADDHELVRGGLKMVLDAQPDLTVVAEAGDGAEALEIAITGEIDLAVLDVSMPRLTGLQVARELHRRRPELHTLMLSVHDAEQYFFEALKAGASGYVLKSAANRDLIEACRATMRGRTVHLSGCGDGSDSGLPRTCRQRRGDARPTRSPLESSR